MRPGIADLLHGPDSCSFLIVEEKHACNHKPVSINHTKQRRQIETADLMDIVTQDRLTLKHTQIIDNKFFPPVRGNLRKFFPEPGPHLLVQSEHVFIHFADDKGNLHIFRPILLRGTRITLRRYLS